MFDWVLNAPLLNILQCDSQKQFPAGVLKNLVNLKGNRLCQSLFFNEVAGLRYATLLKKTFWQRCFLVKFTKFQRISFLWNTTGGCFCIHTMEPLKQLLLRGLLIGCFKLCLRSWLTEISIDFLWKNNTFRYLLWH